MDDRLGDNPEPEIRRSSRIAKRNTDAAAAKDGGTAVGIPPTRAATRGSGRGARGGQRPATRGRNTTAAARGRPAAAAAARGGVAARVGREAAAARRGRGAAAAAAARGNRGPIFGGRQNQLVRRGQANIERPIAGNGGEEGVGRPREEDENAGGDDVEMSDEEEEEPIVHVLGDLNDDEDEDPIVHVLGDLYDDEDEEPIVHDLGDLNDEGGWEDEQDVIPNPEEMEEFELVEERENPAAKRAEGRQRKKEDKEEKENKDALRTDMFGACTVCAEDEVTDPVGCIHCANFIGCRKCANRWYRTSQGNDPQKIASCPLCRHQWDSSMPEVGDMLDLVKPA